MAWTCYRPLGLIPAWQDNNYGGGHVEDGDKWCEYLRILQVMSGYEDIKKYVWKSKIVLTLSVNNHIYTDILHFSHGL
jgi:hypothetical protein